MSGAQELWGLLASASQNPSGVPQRLLDEKAEELRKKKETQDRINVRSVPVIGSTCLIRTNVAYRSCRWITLRWHEHIHNASSRPPCCAAAIDLLSPQSRMGCVPESWLLIRCACRSDRMSALLLAVPYW